MRSNFLAFLALSTSLMSVGSALAQYDGAVTPDAPIVLSNDLKVAAPKHFVKNHSGWVVTVANIPAQYRPDGQPLPCVVARNVGMNGTDQIRFSGGNGKLTGVALEVSGVHLIPKSAIGVVIRLDQARGPLTTAGYVVTPTSMIINTMKSPDFYQVVEQSRRMSVRVGQDTGATEFHYDLDGIGEAFKDLESCYNSHNKRVAKETEPNILMKDRVAPPVEPSPVRMQTITTEASVPADDAGIVPVPTMTISNERFIPDQGQRSDVAVVSVPPPPLAERDVAPVKLPQAVQPERRVVKVSPVQPSAVPAVVPVSVTEGKIVDTFRARKGDSLRDVMSRWAGRSGIDLVWTISNDIELEKDYSFVGYFEDSLGKVLADYPDSGIQTTFAPRALDIGVKPFVVESQPPAVPPIAVEGEDLSDFVPTMPDAPISSVVHQVTSSAPPAPPVSEVAAPPSPPVAVGPTQRWRALQGASMREVIQAWSDDAGFSLIWRAPQDYVVRSSINMTSDYGRAIHILLDQYMAQPGRPTGQIYQDSVTGRKSLVIAPAQT